MTDPRQPWQQPTAPQPTINPKRKTTNIVILSVVGFLVLCCGGVTVIGAFAGDDKPAAKAGTNAGQTVAPQLAAPIVTATTKPAPTTEAPTEATTTPSPSRTKASPTKTQKPAVTKKVTPKPRPTTRKPKPRPTQTKSSVKSGVHPGAFCAPAGALGRTKAGTLMKCKSTASDDRNRWRAA